MYERLIALVGKEGIKKLQTAKVLVVGLGGVGGYALEALVRSGIKDIHIIDGDKIELSNLNRQIISTIEVVGKNKVDVAEERILKLNPEVNVTKMNYNLTKENIDNILNNNYDFIVDACDDILAKFLLIEKSLKNNYELISSMGTANKTNPALFSITDLGKTNNDPIARILRKKSPKEI